jgi:hypothetical protein
MYVTRCTTTPSANPGRRAGGLQQGIRRGTTSSSKPRLRRRGSLLRTRRRSRSSMLGLCQLGLRLL